MSVSTIAPALSPSCLEIAKPSHTIGAAYLCGLVSRVKCGDQTGIEDLYRLLSKGILWKLVRSLGTQDAEDKFQDVFLDVVEGIQSGTLRSPECLLGYASTIVKRCIAGTISERVKSRLRHEDNEDFIQVIDGRDSPENVLIQRQKVETMKRVLQEMPARDREILTRFYLYEQSPQEVCQDMGLTENQFRLLKSRAKARFGELGCRKQATAEMTLIARRSGAHSHPLARSASAAMPHSLPRPTVDVDLLSAVPEDEIERHAA